MLKLKAQVKRVLEAIFELEATVAARWAKFAYWRLKMVQWSISPVPEYFDHRIDLYYQWLTSRDPMWLERGVLSCLVLNRGGRLLELSSGDGFNTRNFYSKYATEIVACDINTCAVSFAQKRNSASNITYIVSDIKKNMPEGPFDNIVWDFGFPLAKYFSLQEVGIIFEQCAVRLGLNGVLSGYTMLESCGDGCEIFSEPQLFQAYLGRFFSFVSVFETKSGGRRNLYYWASQSELPVKICTHTSR